MQTHIEGITHEVHGKAQMGDKPQREMLLGSTVQIQPREEIMCTKL